VKLQGGLWELEIRPERGGRITSLRLAGEELLDRGIGVDDPSATGFVAAGAWGWDEMVPNIEPTETLPDHGEAWRLAWEVTRAAGVELAMRCRGRIVPWELTRALHLRDGAVIAVYTYRNVGKKPHLAYWSAHPLFKFESDMHIGAPVPHVGEGSSKKVFLPKGSVDRVPLRWKSGTEVQVRWDATLTPYVAVWVCNGDLGGYRQVAVEPATGGNDRPDTSQPPPMLGPGKAYRWWLAIEPL
jgi:galactose mutarotase-like enzyme